MLTVNKLVKFTELKNMIYEVGFVNENLICGLVCMNAIIK
jgi:hypothetical protein